MHTTGKEGYEPMVQGLRLGPNDGEEPNGVPRIALTVPLWYGVVGVPLAHVEQLLCCRKLATTSGEECA